MVKTHIIPAVIQEQHTLSSSLASVSSVILDKSLLHNQTAQLTKLVSLLNDLYIAVDKLPLDCHLSEESCSSELKKFHGQAWESMNSVRDLVDALEAMVEGNRWPFPKYSDMLFLV